MQGFFIVLTRVLLLESYVLNKCNISDTMQENTIYSSL